MIAHLSTREPTVSLSHTFSMEYLHVLSDEGKNNILKKLDCFYLHIKSHCLRKPGRGERWGSADFLQTFTI